MATLRVENLELAYEKARVIEGMNVTVPDRKITALVGPNGCGKSTLLRGLARLLKPRTGAIYLDHRDIEKFPGKQLARQMGLLPQSPVAPEGLLVSDLIARGRYPHQSWLSQWSREDEQAVAKALALTGAQELRDRYVDELSGGQRQRVWIAMALAQETRTLLLDEPTTFLDIAYQVEVLELLEQLYEHEDRTIVVVLHDLNQACRYAHHLIALKQGAIVAEGAPAEIVTEELIRDVFEIDCRVIEDPVTRSPLFVPLGNRPGAPTRDPTDVGIEPRPNSVASHQGGQP